MQDKNGQANEKARLIEIGVDETTAKLLSSTDESGSVFKKYEKISASSIPSVARANYLNNISSMKMLAIEFTNLAEVSITSDDRTLAAKTALLNAMRKYLHVSDGNIYFIDEAGSSTKLCVAKASSFGTYVSAILGSDLMGSKYARIIPSKDAANVALYLFDELKKDNDNLVAQFKDFFIYRDRFYPGHMMHSEEYLIDLDKLSSIPAYEVKHGSIDALLNPDKYSRRPEVLDAVLDNLCNGDESLKYYLDKLIASSYFDSRQKKLEIKTFVVISGVTGAGKSFFVNLLSKVFSGSVKNVMSMSANNLKNEFKQSELLRCRFLLTDGDMDGKQVSDESIKFIKNASGGDEIQAQVKNQQQEIKSYLPALIMLVSNFNFTTSDKSSAIEARIVPILPFKELDIDKKLFNSIEKESVIESVANYYLSIWIRMVNGEESIPSPSNRPDEVKKNKELFSAENNSTIAFVNYYELENLVGVPMNLIRQLYSEFCETMGLTELKNKFTQTLKDRFKLETKMCRANKLNIANISHCIDSLESKHRFAELEEFEHLIRIYELHNDEILQQEFIKRSWRTSYVKD